MLPSSVHQAPPSSLGTLGKLPREVRDIIYGYVVCKSYIAIFVKASRCQNSVKGAIPPSADLASIRLSKALSAEIQHVLYEHSMFRCSAVWPIPMSGASLSATASFPGNLYRIMNIEMRLSMYDDSGARQNGYSDEERRISANEIVQMASASLTNNEIRRKSLLIELENPTTSDPTNDLFTASRCLLAIVDEVTRGNALTSFARFERLSVRIINYGLNDRVEGHLDLLKDSQGPTLGPCSRRDCRIPDEFCIPIIGEDLYASGIEFTPLEYMASKATIDASAFPSIRPAMTEKGEQLHQR